MLAGRSGGSATPTSPGLAPGIAPHSVLASSRAIASGNPLGSRAVPQYQTATLNRSDSWMVHVDVRQPLTYISNITGGGIGDVIVFDGKAKPVGKIANLSNPVGLFVDSNGHLWVADYGAHNVLEFRRGRTAPSKTLNDPNEYPYDVTICPNGTVYVANITTTGSLPGNIEVYASGSTNPTRALTFPGQSLYYLFLTCDAAGNVFSTFYNRTTKAGGVVEYPGGKESGARLLPITSPSLTGIKADNAGNLLVVDWSGNTVCEYTEAGSPTGTCIATTGEWLGMAVTRDGKAVLGISETNNNGTELLLPSGTLRQNYNDSGFFSPQSAAFDPGVLGL
jgi:hypothetical protein